MGRNESKERVVLLKELAFHIHKKQSPADALTQCFEAEGKNGRHRKWRQPAAILETDGFVPALVAAELVGTEAAAVLAVVENSGDHRLLSNALAALAEWMGQNPG